MKLILYIRNRQVASKEITYPDYSGLGFETRVELKEEFIKWEVKQLKLMNRNAIQNYPWYIILTWKDEYKEKPEAEFVTFLKEFNASN